MSDFANSNLFRAKNSDLASVEIEITRLFLEQDLMSILKTHLYSLKNTRMSRAMAEKKISPHTWFKLPRNRCKERRLLCATAKLLKSVACFVGFCGA